MGIGERIKEERERLGYTQSGFAALGEASKNSQLSWEKEISFPNAKIMATWSEVGADVAFILTGQRIQPVESRLSKRAQKLLDNYENASESAKHLIEGTASFAASPPTPAEGLATKKKQA
jgi:transcriptional regulator with XRE-family HTH domain